MLVWQAGRRVLLHAVLVVRPRLLLRCTFQPELPVACVPTAAACLSLFRKALRLVSCSSLQ